MSKPTRLNAFQVFNRVGFFIGRRRILEGTTAHNAPEIYSTRAVVNQVIDQQQEHNMKRITLLKTTLATSIAFASLLAMTGCSWGHDDHHDDRDHVDDHQDDHQDNNHQDDNRQDDHQQDPGYH